MSRSFSRIFGSVFLVVGLAVVASNDVSADEMQCEPTPSEYALDNAMGSVAVMANLRGSADSIKVVAKSLLDKALGPQSGPAINCSANCASTNSAVIYRVEPSAYLAENKQRSECIDYERKTSAQPLKFATQRFTSIDELNTWIAAFSRGKGAQGKALYRACTSNCSPRYTFVIETQGDSSYAITPEIICGLARDKRNSDYHLATSLYQQCHPHDRAEAQHEQ